MGVRGPERDWVKEAKAVKLRGLGLTYREVGAAIGVTRQRAQQIVRRAKGLLRANRK